MGASVRVATGRVLRAARWYVFEGGRPLPCAADAAPVCSSLHVHSGRVRAGGVFVAVRGARRDGLSFVAEAAARGAALVVCDRLPSDGTAGVGDGLVLALVPDARTALASLARAFLDASGRAARFVGATGTSGKTTTVHMAASLASSLGLEAFSCGTLGVRRARAGGDGDARWSVETELPNTTPDPVTILDVCRGLSRDAVLCMEVSSQACVQKRVSWLPFRSAAFLNISPEHLDLHGDMATYERAKLAFFRDALLCGEGGCSFQVNASSPAAPAFISEAGASRILFRVSGGGRDEPCGGRRPPPSGDSAPFGDGAAEAVFALLESRSADLLVEVGAVPCAPGGSTGYEVSISFHSCAWRDAGGGLEVLDELTCVRGRLALPGRFNLENAAAAVAMVLPLALDETARGRLSPREALERLAAGLARVSPVPGRMQVVPLDVGEDGASSAPLVFVDYAHKPDALRRVLEETSLMARSRGGRLVVVFGCGGDRDRSKRPLMGRVAASLADVCIVTSDNPRSEDPDSIIGMILEGMDDNMRRSRGVVVEADRRAAIREALREADPRDVIVVAGKGHERVQILGGTVVEFDDAEVVRGEWAALHPGGEERE